MGSICSNKGTIMKDLPRHWQEGRQPPGLLAQEWAHSGSLKRLQEAGRLLLKQRQKCKSFQWHRKVFSKVTSCQIHDSVYMYRGFSSFMSAISFQVLWEENKDLNAHSKSMLSRLYLLLSAWLLDKMRNLKHGKQRHVFTTDWFPCYVTYWTMLFCVWLEIRYVKYRRGSTDHSNT